jgi:hypothetical protein
MYSSVHASEAASRRLTPDPDSYQCSLAVTTRDFATIGATLEPGGANPLTGGRYDEDTSRYVLALMTTAGLCENFYGWLYDVRLSARPRSAAASSRLSRAMAGGCVIAVVQGNGGLAAFAPRFELARSGVHGRFSRAFVARLGRHPPVARERIKGSGSWSARCSRVGPMVSRVASRKR